MVRNLAFGLREALGSESTNGMKLAVLHRHEDYVAPSKCSSRYFAVSANAIPSAEWFKRAQPQRGCITKPRVAASNSNHRLRYLRRGNPG